MKTSSAQWVLGGAGLAALGLVVGHSLGSAGESRYGAFSASAEPAPAPSVSPVAAAAPDVAAAPAALAAPPAAPKPGRSAAGARVLRKAPPAAPSLLDARGAQVSAPPPVLMTTAPEPAPAPRVLEEKVRAAPIVEPPKAPSLLADGWVERPGTQETPEIRIKNTLEETATLSLTQGAIKLRWEIEDTHHEAVPSGTYRYVLYSRGYQHTGRPDQVGNLTCRKWKVYEMQVTPTPTAETRRVDLGDQ